MDYDFKTLASGKNWIIEWNRIRGKESVSLTFRNDTILDSTVLDAIRKHKAWHLYCSERWAGGDLSVFRPVADIVEKISLPAEKSTRIKGLDCLVNLKTMSISGDLSEVDFTKLTRLRSLTVNEECKDGNWHLCKSLDHLLINVPTLNLRKLKALKNLRSLSCGRGLKSLDGIADLPALKELRIGPSHLLSLQSLGHLPNLRLLLVNLLPKLESLNGIEGLPTLEELDVTQCGGLRDVSAISALTKLKMLTLQFCPQIKSLNGIKTPATCNVDFLPNGRVADGF
jgi:hypothetical protein